MEDIEAQPPLDTSGASHHIPNGITGSRKGKERAMDPPPIPSPTISSTDVQSTQQPPTGQSEPRIPVVQTPPKRKGRPPKDGISAQRRPGRPQKPRDLLIISQDIPDGEVNDLPSDDLLDAIHHHTSLYYEHHDLSFPPESEASGSRTTQPLSSSDFDIIERDEDEGNDNESTISGKARKKRKRGSYLKRDMFKAMDGSALVAIGVLVEEHIQHELERIGYQSRQDEIQPDTADPLYTNGDDTSIAGQSTSDMFDMYLPNVYI